MVSLPENLRIWMKLILARIVQLCKLIALFSALASVGILMGERGLTEKRQVEEKRLVLQQDNERLAREIKELERNVTLLRTDPSTIEKVAQRELGMARPNEMVYVFDRTRPPSRPGVEGAVGLRKRDNIP
jgi:cell division protein FtsB